MPGTDLISVAFVELNGLRVRAIRDLFELVNVDARKNCDMKNKFK